MDRPVMNEEIIGNAGQARECVLISLGDRLVRPVAARHDQRACDVAEQESMEGGYREA